MSGMISTDDLDTASGQLEERRTAAIPRTPPWSPDQLEAGARAQCSGLDLDPVVLEAWLQMVGCPANDRGPLSYGFVLGLQLAKDRAEAAR